MRKLNTLTLVSVLALAACGGGSSDGDNNIPIDPPPPNLTRCEQQTQLTVISTSSALEFVTEPSYNANQSAAIVARIAGSDSKGLAFEWGQTAGQSLILKSIKSPILAFQFADAGDYSFSVNISGSGMSFNETINISVSAMTTAQFNVRSDQQVVEGNDVSFRVDRIGVNADEIPSALSWCIAFGPELNIDISNIERPQFKAPAVNSDTIAILRATASVDGETVIDEVLTLITNESAISSPYFDEPVARTFAYRENSSYKSALNSCVYSNQLLSPCTIEQLPLLGQTLSLSEKEKIMERVLVSHRWMGENFETFLDKMDPDSDFALLLQSVTAIVISYDIRPSFYWVVTGAIYLDPTDLWLLAEERDVINEAADFRSAFGNQLGFIMPWRYVKDNAYVSYSSPRELRTDRTMTLMAPDLSSLLFHELAHANDFFPSSIYHTIPVDDQTLLDHYNRRTSAGELISDRVTTLYPLLSDEMYSLADVSFRGETATATQQAYLPSDITGFFSDDNATDYYAYSTSREDTAMLFEEAMMSYRFGIMRDVGITDNPDNATAASITVDWGQRGRIGENSPGSTVPQRAAFVINQILPALDGAQLIGNLPSPIQMNQGQSWLDNLTISPQLSQTPQKINATQSAGTKQFIPELRISGDRHKMN
ncbi:hypothetical protein MK852_07210 [Shewanella benthica]|uniref:hypothetical protein n=1 Tax=Shewanella benthica TaxID=43661 RepID=UPI0018799BFB|nr:hypothetical protein [Shewanella benthica]MBE7214881.1 hypothetical protein [Shewanella benthica]MCL1061923.1 hypothetical protein [Shewanella benthica]